MPKKRPAYRERRDHSEFLCKLNEYVPSKDVFLEELLVQLNTVFEVTEVSAADFQATVHESKGDEAITQVARTAFEQL